MSTMLQAIKEAHVEIKKLCEFISKIKAEIGKPKFEYKSFATDKEVFEEIKANFKDRMYKDVQEIDKTKRDENIDKITEDITNYFIEKYGEESAEEKKTAIADSIHDLEKECVREMILEEHKRPDGRKIDEIRPFIMRGWSITKSTWKCNIYKRTNSSNVSSNAWNEK